MNIRTVVAELFHAEGQTEWHDEANNCFTYKVAKYLMDMADPVATVCVEAKKSYLCDCYQMVWHHKPEDKTPLT
jgi:hypothetical protein